MDGSPAPPRGQVNLHTFALLSWGEGAKNPGLLFSKTRSSCWRRGHRSSGPGREKKSVSSYAGFQKLILNSSLRLELSSPQTDLSKRESLSFCFFKILFTYDGDPGLCHSDPHTRRLCMGAEGHGRGSLAVTARLRQCYSAAPVVLLGVTGSPDSRDSPNSDNGDSFVPLRAGTSCTFPRHAVPGESLQWGPTSRPRTWPSPWFPWLPRVRGKEDTREATSADLGTALNPPQPLAVPETAQH